MEPSASVQLMAVIERLRAQVAELERRLAQGAETATALTALVDVGRQLAETRDPAEAADRIGSSVLRLFRVRRANLYRLERPSGALICVGAAGKGKPTNWLGQRLPPGVGVAGRAAAEGRPVWVADVLADPGLVLTDWMRDQIRDEGFRMVLGIPLMVQGEVLGVLALGDAPGRAFSEGELKLLSAFAAQAAVALENARLFGEGQRELAERTRAEAALQASTATLRALVESSPTAIVALDLDRRVTMWNPAAERIFGWRAAEVLGRPNPIISGETTDEFQRLQERVLRGEGLVGVEVRRRRKDGSWVDLGLSTAALRDAAGNICGSMGVLADVTGRKAAEAERARLSQAVEQAAEVIMVTDPAGTVQYVNPAFEAVSGYSRGEILGRSPALLKSGKHGPAFYADLWATLARGEVWTGTFVNRRKDGSLYEEEAVISPVRDESGQVVNHVAVKRDVTRERQMEAQLRQAQKMEAVGRLAGGVAHDFNNVLMAILGQCELLQLRLGSGDPRQELVEDIRQAADRAAGLTRQLLAFSRKQLLQPKVLDLNTLVTGLEKLLRRLVGEDIRVVTSLSQTPAWVRADPGQLEQVIMNLAVNARDAMSQGGTLILETGTVELEAPAAGPPGPYVSLAVRDTGCGMDAATLDHLFEPFFTTKEGEKGTGLGLATVYGIIQQSGGQIAVASVPGQGSTFMIYLPRVQGAAVSEAAPPAPPRPAPGRETILVAEDDAGVRGVVCQVLEMQGYSVLEATQGAEALAVADRHAGPIHLLVTDVVMPGMTGPELAAHLTPLRPGVKVLYMSGYSDDAVGQHGVLDPGVAFLQKPFSPQTLARRVREILDGSAPGGSGPGRPGGG